MAKSNNRRNESIILVVGHLAEEKAEQMEGDGAGQA